MDVSRRSCTRDQRTPISLPQEREGVQPPRQDVLCQIFGSQFEVIFLLHYSVTSVSDCFCFSMGVTDSCYTCFYFWNLCYIFFLFQKIFLYTVWRRKTFIQRTEFFLGWILSRERASSQGHMFGAAGPVKLDLNLEDFLEPGVRQLWRSRVSIGGHIAEFEDSVGLPSLLLLISRSVESDEAKIAAGLDVL